MPDSVGNPLSLLTAGLGLASSVVSLVTAVIGYRRRRAEHTSEPQQEGVRRRTQASVLLWIGIFGTFLGAGGIAIGMVGLSRKNSNWSPEPHYLFILKNELDDASVKVEFSPDSRDWDDEEIPPGKMLQLHGYWRRSYVRLKSADGKIGRAYVIDALRLDGYEASRAEREQAPLYAFRRTQDGSIELGRVR